MKRSRPQVTAWMLAALLCAAAPAGAVTLNSSFESGDTSDWTIVGDVSVVDSTFGVTPTDGSYQLLMTTGGGAVTRRGTERAMGLRNRTIQNIFENQILDPGESTGSEPTEGSAIQQSFDAEVGDVLTFDWNFLTDEFTAIPPQPDIYTDFLWGHLEGPSSNEESVLAHVNQDPSNFFASGSSFNDETGYQTFTFTFVETGTYTLTLGVHDVEDTAFDSAGIFDNFFLRKAPEPNTFLLVASGLLGLNWYARRHKAPR
jgi:hypothetical protein